MNKAYYKRLPKPERAKIGSCDLVIDDLFNIDIKLKSNWELKDDIDRATAAESTNHSMSVRSIPINNHIKVQKAKANQQKAVKPLDMSKLESLLYQEKHYAFYNQNFMLKSMDATQDERLRYHKYIDQPLSRLGANRKETLVEFIIRERHEEDCRKCKATDKGLKVSQSMTCIRQQANAT